MFTNGLTAKQCNASIPLGMQDGQISNQSITASSHYANYPPWEGRLNAGIAKSWYAVSRDTKPWIQVDLGKLTWLKGVATQGKMFSLFVKTYKLAYSSDEVRWFIYREPDAKDDKVRTSTSPLPDTPPPTTNRSARRPASFSLSSSSPASLAS